MSAKAVANKSAVTRGIQNAECGVPTPALNILIAEDDPNDVLLVRRAFHKAQMQAGLFFVSNGQEVISYLQRQRPFEDPIKYPFPNLLLLDLNMPELGGLEVLQWLAAKPELAGLRVALFSSCLPPEACAHAIQLGAQCCVSKPLDPLELVPVFRDLQSLPARQLHV